MNYDNFINKYWKYYLTLENKFIETINYVELDELNFETFSNNYAMLLQAIGSEINNTFKELCVYENDENKGIKDFSKFIKDSFPELASLEIIVIGYDITFSPFESWRNGNFNNSPKWWSAYNKIKHSRIASYNEASLKNVLYALGALMLIEIITIKAISIKNVDVPDAPVIPSSLFSIKNWKFKYVLKFPNLDSWITLTDE